VRVTRVPLTVPTSAPGGTTNCYLVGAAESLLVDPAARSDALDAAVADRPPAHVLATHTHPDHVGAVAAYAAETDATVWARRPDAFREATGVDPDATLREGTTLDVDGESVTVVDVPGHAPDHVAVETPSGTLVGDLATATGSVAVAAPGGDLRAYLVSLRRLYARNPSRLYPGHGPVVDDVRGVLSRLVAHRHERERRVRAAVRRGASSLDEVVEAAYEKSLDGVFDLARATTAAHLEKLHVEGDVRWCPDEGTVGPA
jgi:glyoxylase-like metal-dependent hydrolase (beta-lactamase superfamily II)